MCSTSVDHQYRHHNIPKQSLSSDQPRPIGSSKVTTSQRINKKQPKCYHVKGVESPENIVISRDLFGNEKTERSQFSRIYYYQYSTVEDRLIWQPGNGLHLIRVASGKKTYVDHERTGFSISPEQGAPIEVKNRVPHSKKAGRFLSPNSAKQICKSFGLIHYHAKKTGKSVKFVTLTLPTLQMHHDKTIKKECINHFNTWLRQIGCECYLWIQENQQTGTCHFHYAMCKYIDYMDLRKKWNSIIDKLGYIERYQKQMRQISFEDYKTLRSKENLSNEKLVSAYKHGKETDWSQPNTTDIKAVYSIAKAGRYMAKYMAKMEMDEPGTINDGRYSLKQRKITGKKWSRSEVIKAGCRSNYIALDSQSFAIAMDAIDRLSKDSTVKVIREDYRVHLYGNDEKFLHFFDLKEIDYKLNALIRDKKAKPK